MLNTPRSLPAVKTWHCGTLTYTKMGLISLFAFMIWGDFCNVMVGQVVPSIMPLKFKELGASNAMIGLFMTSIPSVLSLLVNPFVSFKSDRHRSKRGRRIPFILYTLLPLCVALVALAFGDEITRLALPVVQQYASHSPATVAVVVFGLLLVVFLFFQQFVHAVFCGLFNDVVPTALMGRFMGTMQIVGGAAGFCYNYFVFKYAETNMREIFIGAAVLYFLGVGMMCLFVKETEHPPLTESEKQASSGLLGVLSYFKESFSHKFYWTKFAYISSTNMNSAGIGVFGVFFYKEMGLTLDDVGKAAAILSVGGMATAYFASIYIDRWHPLRIIAYTAILAVVFSITGFVWVFLTLAPNAFFWLHLLGAGLIMNFSNSVAGVANLPFDMRLHPHSRFTQFCSAQALLRCLCTAVAGVAGGLYFDVIKDFFHGSNYAYRFGFIWGTFWVLVGAFLAYKLYRQWHALGGDKNFHNPANWSKTGFEEQEHTPYVGPQSKSLRIVMGMIHAVMLLSIVYLIPLSFWLWQKGWSVDLQWHLYGILPASILLYGWWIHVERSLKADLFRCRAGETPRNGIPHHGILVLKSGALLLLLGIWFGKTIAAVNAGLEGGVLVLGGANLLTNMVFIVSFLVLRKMERGHEPMLDYDGHAELTANK